MIQQQLDAEFLLPQQRLERLRTMSLLYLYEGDFLKASVVLEKARSLIAAEPDRLQRDLPMILFLQGMAALRRGETENCVDCSCDSSCIFPIQPQAVHQKPEGSREAFRYFTAYLELFPDDVGVRWLLNVAFMTLGEDPGHVPAQHLNPLKSFQSEIDVARVADTTPHIGR